MEENKVRQEKNTEIEMKKENSLPRFVKLKKVVAK